MVYGKPQILIALGSPSDIGILKGINYPSSAEFYQGIASAHRTEDVVAEFAKKPWDAIIAGAGYVNALANAYKGANFLSPRTLVFGLPIWNDDAIANAASFFSSHVTPPGVPIAYGQTINFAVGAAARLTSRNFKNISILSEEDGPYSEPRKERIKGACAEIKRNLDSLQIDHTSLSLDEIEQSALDDLLITIGLTQRSSGQLRKSREAKMAGNQLCGYMTNQQYSGATVLVSIDNEPAAAIEDVISLSSGLENYLNKVRDAIPALIFHSPKNLALFAAQVLARDNKELESRLRIEFEKQREKYNAHKELVKLN